MERVEDSFFDLVCHLDGMEHIPAVWEKACLKEAIRVSKKYVFYEIKDLMLSNRYIIYKLFPEMNYIK